MLKVKNISHQKNPVSFTLREHILSQYKHTIGLGEKVSSVMTRKWQILITMTKAGTWFFFSFPAYMCINTYYLHSIQRLKSGPPNPMPTSKKVKPSDTVLGQKVLLALGKKTMEEPELWTTFLEKKENNSLLLLNIHM